jgi:nicotinate phosphoribosyltransferase
MGGLLLTDLYELRMAASYLRRGMDGLATFSLFVRRLPSERGFLVAAGLEDCLSFLEGLAVHRGDRAYLRSIPGFTSADVRALARLRFTGEVWAVPEGSVVFEDEPLLEVTAPIAEAQVVETYLLNQITFQTAIASKAARCRLAAQGRTLVDFAFRRTHGIEAGVAAARASAIAGFTATSNVAAARRYGLTPSGTMAHSYVEAFTREADAFAAFALDFPEHPTFLVDTYDTEAGVRHAIQVAQDRGLGDAFSVRLDSGDLEVLSHRVRRLLDEAGCPDAGIFVSGGLDEHDIDALVCARAPIDAFGVGTKMGVSADAPSLDSAYKLVVYDGRPVLKLSAGKSSLPGAKQVFRNLRLGGDVLGLRTETVRDREPLLGPVMIAGRRTNPPDTLAAMCARLAADIDALPETALRIENPETAPVLVSAQLEHLRDQCIAEISVPSRYGLGDGARCDRPVAS